MTCLAALTNKEGRLIFAADRRLSWETGYHQSLPIPKVVKRNGLLLSACGPSFFLMELVYFLPIPPIAENVDVMDYMFNSFMDNIVLHFRSKNYISENERGCKDFKDDGAGALIGLRGQLFELNCTDTDIDIMPVNTPFATGSGGDFALGSLLTTEDSKLNEHNRLIKALTVAAKCSNGCDNNIDIVEE